MRKVGEARKERKSLQISTTYRKIVLTCKPAFSPSVAPRQLPHQREPLNCKPLPLNLIDEVDTSTHHWSLITHHWSLGSIVAHVKIKIRHSRRSHDRRSGIPVLLFILFYSFNLILSKYIIFLFLGNEQLKTKGDKEKSLPPCFG